MWPFSTTTETQEPTPAPIDREEQALNRVREIKAALNELDAEMLRFRSQHSIIADRFGRLLQIICPLTARAAIETEWHQLLRRRDKLMEAWPVALSELNDVRRREK
jgi:hypothetical protein